jgi:hypothetical protein
MSIEDSSIYISIEDIDKIALTTYSQYEYEGYSLDTTIDYSNLGVFNIMYGAHIPGDPLESINAGLPMELWIIPDIYPCGFNIPDVCSQDSCFTSEDASQYYSVIGLGDEVF